MESLPVEIVELILLTCEAKVLAISIPRVSKSFKKLSKDDSNIWRAKCAQQNLDLNSKPSDQTWKGYYFNNKLKLFPLFGFTMTKTTKEELLATAMAKASVSGSTEYIEYKKHNFWITNGKFNMMYLTYTDILPDEWISQGLSWTISWLELKQLLKKKNGNYKVTKVPHQGRFQDKDCFTAGITSVVKQGDGADAFYYQLSFNFNYMEGTEMSPDTLYAITIRGNDSMYGNETFINAYNARECKENDTV